MIGKEKNSYGYLRYHRNQEIIKTIFLFILPIGVLLLGIFLTGSKKNLLTLVAVLGLLPAAKELVLMIMSIKAVKYSCKEEHYNKIQNLSNEFIMLYDLFFTTYDINFSVVSMTCQGGSLIGYTEDKAFDHKKFEEHLKKMLAQNRLKVSTIKIFDNEDKYIDRVAKLGEQEEIDMNILHLMTNLSI